MSSENIIEVTDSNFKSEVLEAEGPVLVDFWAAWCGPCRAVAPVVEEIANETKGRLKVGKLNVDANPVTPQSYGVMGIPTLIVYINGVAVERVVGFMPKAQLMTRIEDHLSE